MNNFTCAHCDRTFEKKWSDTEAKAEYAKNFPHASKQNMALAVLCDECYEAFMDWFKGLPAQERELFADEVETVQ